MKGNIRDGMIKFYVLLSDGINTYTYIPPTA
jgi:hypothetical protein